MNKEVQAAKLQQEVLSLQEQNNRLHNENDTLRKHLHDIEISEQCLTKVVVKKKWSQLTNPGTRYRRKKLYKKIIDRAVCCITECTKAKISLCLDEENVDILWSEKEMDQHRNSLGITNQKYKFIRDRFLGRRRKLRNWCRPARKLSHLNAKEGIFNEKCQYSRTHIRRVLTVMDDNRISQDAYQSLRTVCSGHMPSLNSIKREKRFMSQQLPVCGDQSVSFPKIHL